MKNKVCVYAISKNEVKFVDRWMDSMNEADEIYVLDTGSTDDTVEKLRNRGAIVKIEEIKPWRFDIARNKSMDMLPEDTDICVCTDIDEVLEPGWREKVENAWINNVQRLRYRYTWSFKEDGSEGTVFWTDKIHSYGSFRWTHPVHEVLEYTKTGTYIFESVYDVQLNHLPDKTKSRAMYFDLLKLSVEEDPDDDRNMHYLGREYMYHKMWDECIETLKKHLNMPSATWEDERAASMRYIAFSYRNKENIIEAKKYLYKAIAEAPHLREPFMDMASMLFDLKDWFGTIYMINSALSIVSRPMSYICEPNSWGSTPYDLISIAYYNIGLPENAITNLKKAIELSPNDERLKKNLNIMEKEYMKD